MSVEVPPMLWFTFWVCVSIGVLGFGFFMAIIIHRGHMKTLEILRFYAEKGVEPPPAVVEMLSRQMGDCEATGRGQQIGQRAGNFTGQVVGALAGGGIAWWRMNAGGPQWVVYFFAFSAVLFAVLAILTLITSYRKSAK